MKRREFLTRGTLGLAGSALTGSALAGSALAAAAPRARASGTTTWKMATSWTERMPILMDGARQFAALVEELTAGALRVEVHPAGELCGPLEVWEAVSSGEVQCCHSASYYFADKHPGTQWFTSVPWGMPSAGYNAWFHAGGGLALWEELYARFSMVPRPMGTSGFQTGGWFNTEIRTVDDLRGLRLRFPGLAGKIYSRAGAEVVPLPGSEVVRAMAEGRIDGTDWVGPYMDLSLGLNRVARLCYYPGWQEPTGFSMAAFNAEARAALPPAHRRALDVACAQVTATMQARYDVENAAALKTLEADPTVSFERFPAPVLQTLRTLSAEALEAEADLAPMARRIHDEYTEFMGRWLSWMGLAEEAYFELMLT